MELELFLNRLQLTTDHLKNLNEDQYDFNDFITNFKLVSDSSKKTVSGYGTVCDTAGWYPNWYPESGFTYELTKFSVNLFYQENQHRSFIVQGLTEYHGLSRTLIGVLFFGETFIVNANKENQIWFKSSNCLTLKETIQCFEIMYQGLEMGLINPDWCNRLSA